jgi:hypothetical protein
MNRNVTTVTFINTLQHSRKGSRIAMAARSGCPPVALGAGIAWGKSFLAAKEKLCLPARSQKAHRKRRAIAPHPIMSRFLEGVRTNLYFLFKKYFTKSSLNTDVFLLVPSLR